MFKLSTIVLVIIFVINNDVCGVALPAVDVQSSLYQIPDLGQRPLIVKSYPAVENYQSDLYEVYMEPYTFVSVLDCFYLTSQEKSTFYHYHYCHHHHHHHCCCYFDEIPFICFVFFLFSKEYKTKICDSNNKWWKWECY